MLQRERFGGSQNIDVAMLDSAMVMMTSIVAPYLNSKKRPERTGNRGYSLAPTADTFTTADGLLTLAVIQQPHFEKLCREIDRPALIGDPRFADRVKRVEHGTALKEAVEQALATRTALDWETRLTKVGLAAAAVREIPEAIAYGDFEESGLVVGLSVPGAPCGQVKVLNNGFRFEHDGPHVRGRPPHHGEHTNEILRNLKSPSPV